MRLQSSSRVAGSLTQHETIRAFKFAQSLKAPKIQTYPGFGRGALASLALMNSRWQTGGEQAHQGTPLKAGLPSIILRGSTRCDEAVI